MNSPIEAVADAYVGLASESASEESTHIRGLLVDLRSAKYVAHTQAVLPDLVLTSLEAVNEEFFTIYQRRMDEQAVPQLPRLPQRVALLLHPTTRL